MDDPTHAALQRLRSAIPGIELHTRRNRRTLISLRGRPGTLRLSLHPLILEDADHAPPIIEWVARRGRGGAGTCLRALLTRTQERIASAVDPNGWAEASHLPTLGRSLDLESTLTRIMALGFPDLPRPRIQWARCSAGRLITIRFGSYRRKPRPGSISLHPRLQRPWIASVFFDHVLYHELCHHRQACQPLAGRETAHSVRFRTWDRAFPGYRQARAWERAALPWLLDDRPPPWWQPVAGEARHGASDAEP